MDIATIHLHSLIPHVTPDIFVFNLLLQQAHISKYQKCQTGPSTTTQLGKRRN